MAGLPVVFLDLHNEVIEQCLDAVERRITGTVARPVTGGRLNVARRSVLRRVFERTGAGPGTRRPGPVWSTATDRPGESRS
jgi:hypothetical protein